MIHKNILGTIGNTPIVRLGKMFPGSDVQVLAKLEGQNPGGSIKDRIALYMIGQAEREGRLTKDRTIIEPTSGNTGIGLAMIGTIKGYKVTIVMSEAVSIERRQMIQAFGAKVVLTDPTKGTDGAIMKAREMVKAEPEKYFMPDQFSNEYNKVAHYETTAREIWEQTDGGVTHFVAAIGTSGTIMGVSEHLKKYNPSIRVVCAYPVKGHYIQGLKNMEEAIVPAIYDPSKIDSFIDVESEAAFGVMRRLAREEGVFAGMSAGAAIVAAAATARTAAKGSVIVAILPDRGEKYLSTGVFMQGS